MDERYIWDGGSLLEVLNSSDSVTERELNGPAVDQVLAVEMVGGSNPGVNWLLTDARETVRDVARGVAGDGGVSVSAVDHVFYDAFGDQSAPQTAIDPQLQPRIGFQGMATDALAGFTNFASGGSTPGSSAFGLNYSVAGGTYDSVSETKVSGAAGNESGGAESLHVHGQRPDDDRAAHAERCDGFG